MNIWDVVDRPILALAPMAGYTDSSYRQLIKEICPEVVCFTEFTSVDGILHGNDATMRQIFFNAEKERPIVAQIFGKKPKNFSEAAKILKQMGVDAIDINMGCPAKKIISSDHGSALLKDCALSEEIVRATVEATSLPVSIKMRIGTSEYDADYFFSFAKRMEACGIKLITIHGRTSKQMYAGIANWEPIYELKKILSIPVLGNGDVKSGDDALKKLNNLDGVMVGRSTFGNPWVMCDIAHAFSGQTYTYPSWQEKMKWITRHIELSCAFKGEHWGMIEMRKHLAWYIKGMPNASELRKNLVTVSSKESALRLIEQFFSLSSGVLAK